MPAIDECSRHNMPRGMEGDGCSKGFGFNSFVSKSFVSKRFGSTVTTWNATTWPSPICQSSSYAASQFVDSSYDRRRNDQGLPSIAIMSREDMPGRSEAPMEAARFLAASRWSAFTRVFDALSHHGGRPSDRRGDSASPATGGRRARRSQPARMHGRKISGCSEPEHAMSMPTKIPLSHANRATIFRLSWHGFLVCAFAMMMFLAWATLRQAPELKAAPTGAEIVNAE